MLHYYKIALAIGVLVLPCIVLTWRNNFDSSKKTALRFGFAVLVVWAYFLASRFVVDAMDLSFASTQEEV
jgi:hypothetical protein